MEGEPDTSTLKDFVNGRLSLESLPHIQNYLRNNPDALDRLGIMEDDSFVLSLRECARAAKNQPRLSPPQMDSAISRINSSSTPTLQGYRFASRIKRHEVVSTWAAWKEPSGANTNELTPTQVIVKVFHHTEKMAVEDLERFHREADVLRNLNHPNIVRYIDSNSLTDHSYLTMEYLHGIDLSQLVASLGILSPGMVLSIALQILNGLQYLSQQGVIHRDIKPSNIILGSDGRIRLIDFGLAKPNPDSSDKSLTRSEQFLGTIDYVSPEQAMDPKFADIRSDLYSVGCNLFKLLTGKAPFSSPNWDNPLKKVVAHAIAQPPKLKQLRQDLPDCLCDCIERLLAKNPADRFQTPNDAIAALSQWHDLHASIVLDEATLRLIQNRDNDLWYGMNSSSLHNVQLVTKPLKNRTRRINSGSRILLYFTSLLVIVFAFSFYLSHNSLLAVFKSTLFPGNDVLNLSATRSEKLDSIPSPQADISTRRKTPLREGYYFGKERNLRNGSEQNTGIVISDDAFVYSTPDNSPPGQLRRFGCVWTRLYNHELERDNKFVYIEQPGVNGYLLLEIISEDRFKATCWRGTGFSINDAINDPAVGYFHSTIEGTWWSPDTLFIGPAPQLHPEIAKDWPVFLRQYAPRCVRPEGR